VRRCESADTVAIIERLGQTRAAPGRHGPGAVIDKVERNNRLLCHILASTLWSVGNLGVMVSEKRQRWEGVAGRAGLAEAVVVGGVEAAMSMLECRGE
jgi:hypothetical protein